MSSTYGEKLKLSIFGQSHGPAIGMTLDGIPAGLPVDFEALNTFMARRAPGQGSFATARKEADQPEFLSGLVDGFTCGAPLSAIIRNTNTRSGDYSNLKDCPRPGHADFPAQIKYKGYQDVSGGGHFSGRLTAPLCIAGGLCKQWLELKGIQIGAHISSIAGISDKSFDWVSPDLTAVQNTFPVLDTNAGKQMHTEIEKAKADGDSVGGTIECSITGLPAGLGEPMFGGMESKLAQIIYGVPAVKGLEFGSGFAGSEFRGSQNNDPYSVTDNRITTTTNNAGGILGGITTGMPLIFKVAIKPTPSISRQQLSVSLGRMEQQELSVQGRHDPCIVPRAVQGRHDPCIVPRAVPVIEAAAAIAIFDMYLLDCKLWEE